MKTSNYFIKKFFKVLTIIFIALLAFLVLLFAAAKFKEKEIADIALKKIGKSINAPLVIDDISLNLIRRFPRATLELKGVWLGSPDALPVAGSLILENDTIAGIEKIYISVLSIPLFRGEFEIMKVEIRGGYFNYIVDSLGRSNIDFLINAKQKDISDTTSHGLSVLLKELILSDIQCNYIDSVNLINAHLIIPEAEVMGEIKDEYLYGSASGELKLSECNYKSTNLYFMKETSIDFNVAYLEDSVTLKEVIINTDGADLNITGTAIIKDTIETDIRVQGTNMDIGELVKYVPGKTLDKLGLQKVSGMFAVDGSVNGFIAGSLFPEIQAEFSMVKGNINMLGYPAVKNIAFDGTISNGKLRNNETTSLVIRNFHAETENSRVDVSGNLKNLNRIQYDFTTNLTVDAGEFENYIPDTVLYGINGRIQARMASKGALPDSMGIEFIDYLIKNSQLDITLDNLTVAVDSSLSLDSFSGKLIYDFYHFTARNIQLSIPVYNINLNNSSFDAQLTGMLSDLSNIGIDIKSLQIRTDSSVVYGSGRVRNLEAPAFNFSSNMKLRLGEFKSLVPDDLITNLSGGITANMTIGGSLDPDSIPEQIMDIVFKKASSRFNFDKVSVNMADTLIQVEDLSGQLQLRPDTIRINSMSGVYRGIDFNVDSTKIANLYNSVVKNQSERLFIDGRIALGDLDYTLLAPFVEGNTDSTNTIAGESVSPAEIADEDPKPTNYSFFIKGKLRIKSFSYNKALVNDISAKFSLRDSVYIIDQFRFSAFDGEHNTSVKYIDKGYEQSIYIKNSAQGLDVVNLLKDFDNFEAYYEPKITYENISGVLSTKLDAQIIFSGDSLVMDKFYVRGDILLEKGGIYNYPPIQVVAKDLPAGIDNLDIVEFKTIDTDIFVFRGAIYVPSTLIVSNKLDARVLGNQNFGEDYDFHAEVFLRDILLGKKEKNKNKQEKIADEGRSGGIWVRSYSENGRVRGEKSKEDDRDDMNRTVKSSERLLSLRFFPKRVSYNTGVK